MPIFERWLQFYATVSILLHQAGRRLCVTLIFLVAIFLFLDSAFAQDETDIEYLSPFGNWQRMIKHSPEKNQVMCQIKNDTAPDAAIYVAHGANVALSTVQKKLDNGTKYLLGDTIMHNVISTEDNWVIIPNAIEMAKFYTLLISFDITGEGWDHQIFDITGFSKAWNWLQQSEECAV